MVCVCVKVVGDKVKCQKGCVTNLSVKDGVCDKVVCERWCVTKWCVKDCVRVCVCVKVVCLCVTMLRVKDGV